MTSLLALLSQRQPNLQTRKGLIWTGLQNDFILPDGKLPVRSDLDYLDRIRELVPAFREHGDVIWVRSQYEADREVATGVHETGDSVIAGPLGQYSGTDDGSDDEGDSPVPSKRLKTSAGGRTGRFGSEADEELFLTSTPQREACCIKDTHGAEYAAAVKKVIDKKDLQLTKTYYSAFGSTSLLLTLRSKLITELYVGGNMTNLSVFATAMDAARYGIKITLLEDCLGYRNKDRHEAAIKTLKDVMGADVVTAAQAIETLRHPPQEEPEDEESEEESEDDIAVGEDAAAAVAAEVEVDSDEEEESDFEMPINVRARLAYRSKLPAREIPRSSELEPDDESSDQARSPTRSRSKKGHSDEPPKHESSLRKNQIEHELSRSSSLRASGLKVDEPPASSGKPWLEYLDRTLGGKIENKHRSIAKSTHPGLGALAALTGLDQNTVDEYEAMMKAFQESNIGGSAEEKGKPLLGEGKEKESAGSRIVYDLMPADLAETIFDKLNREVTWQRMHHLTGEVPRLVCCQGTIGEDGSTPVYRHPSDYTLAITSWTPTINLVRKAVEEVVGHPLNHALIQLYRSGTDFISEHSDKTLDIAKDSSIVNVSFGAQRTMRLRTKRVATRSTAEPNRTAHRVPLPHNSACLMSLETNAKYLHAISADKRPRVELTEAEKAFDGQRISLTFRHIATFLNQDSTRIWGQGATGRRKEDARAVVNGEGMESERLVKAFGRENGSSGVEWEEIYGRGSDVLHLR